MDYTQQGVFQKAPTRVRCPCSIMIFPFGIRVDFPFVKSTYPGVFGLSLCFVSLVFHHRPGESGIFRSRPFNTLQHSTALCYHRDTLHRCSNDRAKLRRDHAIEKTLEPRLIQFVHEHQAWLNFRVLTDACEGKPRCIDHTWGREAASCRIYLFDVEPPACPRLHLSKRGQ